MKKIIVFALLTIGFAQFSQAQKAVFGLKGGISKFKIRPDAIDLTDPNGGSYTFDVKSAPNGYFFGAYARIGGFVHLQPEILYNNNKVNYTLTSADGGVTAVSETYQSLDVPVLLGLKLGPIRVQGGPVGRFHLKSQSNLGDVVGFSADYDKMKVSGQLGVGLNLGKHVTLDLRWQNDMGKFGDHVEFGGQKYEFDKSSTRLLMSIGYTF